MTGMTSVISNLLVCVMAHNMAYLGQFLVCVWEEYIFCDQVECWVNVSWNQWAHGVFHFCILYFLPTTSVSYWEKRGFQVWLWVCLILLSVLSVFALLIWNSLVRCIKVLGCYVLVASCLFCHYVVFLFTPGNCAFQSSLSDTYFS